jgi:hypothetical protein
MTIATAESEAKRNLIGALGDITKENEEMERHDEVEMHPDASIMYQPAGELRKGAVEDFER